MIGKDRTMPKRARYPVFLSGLLVIIVGGILADSRGAPPDALGAVVVAGLALLVLSVIVR
jgi:hypothetical protein